MISPTKNLTGPEGERYIESIKDSHGVTSSLALIGVKGGHKKLVLRTGVRSVPLSRGFGVVSCELLIALRAFFVPVFIKNFNGAFIMPSHALSRLSDDQAEQFLEDLQTMAGAMNAIRFILMDTHAAMTCNDDDFIDLITVVRFFLVDVLGRLKDA